MKMTIEVTLPYLVAFLGGVALGLFYFGALWFTVKKIPGSSHPKRLLLSSALLRFFPTLLTMYLVVKADPVIFLIMLSGFFAVRYYMIRRVTGLSGERTHAA